MAVRTIDAAELARVLSMGDAVEVLENAFGTDRIPTSTKQRSGLKNGELLVMPSSDDQATGVKVLTINSSNPDQERPLIQGVYVLFSDVLEPVAIIDGAALTGLRTAAVSGLATRFLARQDARRLVLFGAGTQAQTHLEAMCAVRPIEEVRIIGRTPARVARLAEQASAMGLKADVASAEAVADADIVCTCTTATEPLFEGSLLPDGVHINATGTHRAHATELDSGTIRRGRLVVETREAALAEAEDILVLLESGEIDSSHIVADLPELVRGKTVRARPGDVTIFKSVGIAYEDLVIARTAFGRLGERECP
jgi:ornithine cyclodeaminase/alanine dehydrogenase-like protein (mu-crystallin family)